MSLRPKAKLQSGNSRQQKDGKQNKKRPQVQILSLSRRFIVEDPVQYFIQKWEATWVAWISLGQAMALPPCIPVVELDLESRVMGLHRVLSGNDDNLPPRFGHVQLVLFLDALERRIRQDRLHNLIVAKHRRRYETQAIDMFLSSLDRALNSTTPRSRIWTLKRFGDKWNDMVGSLVLLLLIFSRAAESSVKDSRKIDNSTFRALAADARKRLPIKLVTVCTVLAKATEIMLAARTPINHKISHRMGKEIQRYLCS
ncbi:hypothetical protein J3459_010293 [Metarhizium acridum]|nr:hypothetical protein J3459_010293 [Metarhizium acridum]